MRIQRIHTGSRQSSIAGANLLCIRYTPEERAGDYSLEFLHDSQRLRRLVLDKTVTGNVGSESVLFQGYDAKAVLVTDAKVSVVWSDDSKDIFLSSRQEAVEEPIAEEEQQDLVGCYNLSLGFANSDIAQHPLARAVKLCVSNQRAGSYIFGFYDRKSASVLDLPLQPIRQVSCSGCREFENQRQGVLVTLNPPTSSGPAILRVSVSGEPIKFSITKEASGERGSR